MRLLPLLLLAFLPACQTPGAGGDSAARELATWMTGSFSSAEQAAEDPEGFFDIRLFMVPIWTERDDGPWLYVEQAAARALEKPYRQRVYRLVDVEGGGVRSDVYLLPGDPLELAGAWQEPGRFDAFGPDGLDERVGCSIHLERDGEVFGGSTRGSECSSSLRGSSYATSEVVIRPDVLTSWDRGFDADDQQVWGATKGPYVFAKTASL